MSDNPHAFLANLRTQLLLSRCVGMMAEIGIADQVAELVRAETPEFAPEHEVQQLLLVILLGHVIVNPSFRD